MANTFNFGNKKWATKEGSVLAYNSENNNFKPLPFDFTRASSATRVNENGLIEVVGSNEPRIDYLNNADGHLLLEPSRTNLIPQSEDTTGYSHYNYGGGLIVDTYGYPSPDGGNNASRLVYTNSSAGSGGALLTQNVTLNATGTYTLSLWIKSISGLNKIRVSPKDTGSQGPSGEVFTITNEWQRYTHTFTNDGGTSRGLQFRISETEDSGDRTFDVWGMQIEEGSYATSYIPTSGSSVTRNADNCSQTPASGVIGQTEGTLFIDFVYGGTSNTISDNFNLTLGTWASNIMTIGQYNNALYARIYESSTLYFNQDFGNMTIGQRYKCAIGYAANNVSFYVNGSLIATDTSVNIPTVSNISLNRGTLENAKKINQVILHNTRLSNAELATLTSL